MNFEDMPPDVCYYDLLELAREAETYASKWKTEQEFTSNATIEQCEYLLSLISGAGEAVAQLKRAGISVPEHWDKLRLEKNLASHVFSTRNYVGAWRLASDLLPSIGKSLSASLRPIAGYDRRNPDRFRYFSNDTKN